MLIVEAVECRCNILQIINRRFPNVSIQIIPVKVQGEGAAEQIVAAVEWLNLAKDANVAILARGGGSLEDLQAFNSEPVARAIFASEIPVLTGIGHETDFTIADFTADYRASTPSVAAETASPSRTELSERLNFHKSQLTAQLIQRIQQVRENLKNFDNTEFINVIKSPEIKSATTRSSSKAFVCW